MARARLVAAIVVLLVGGLLFAQGTRAEAQQPFRVSPIEATFRPQAQTTDYAVLVTAPSNASLKFTWSGPDCGTWGPTAPGQFTWVHPHPPCDPTTDHKTRTIVVEVTDGATYYRCTYQGAASGVGPACTVQQPAASNASTPAAPVTATPADDGPESGGSGLGWGLGLGAGVLLIAGGTYAWRTRTRSGERWEDLEREERVAQERLLGEFQSLLRDVNAHWAGYRRAVDTFRTKFTLALSGSTEMQGLLTEWAEVRGIAKKQDLAFAIVTLLWSGAGLAVKGMRWLRGGAAAAEGATGGAAVAEGTAAATSGVRSATRGEFVTKYLGQLWEARQARVAALAEEAGLSAAEVAARWGDDIEAAGMALMEIVAQRRGWVTLTAEAEGAIGRLLVQGRAAVGGRGVVAAEDIARLQQWAQQPGFWERLGKAAARMDEIGWMGHKPELHEFIGLLYQADDIAFLKAIVEAGGDLAKVRAALGPAQAVVAGSLDSALAGVIANAPSALAPGAALTVAQQGAGNPVTELGNLSNFVDQFGITGKFDTMSAPGLFASELWALVTSPFETYQRYRFTDRAQDLYDAFLKDHADELTGMSTALNDALRELEGLQRSLDRAGVGDSSSRLAERAKALRDILDRMRANRAGHEQDFAQREAHITQKIATIEHVAGMLAAIRQRLPQMIDWLRSLREGRGLFEMMNPEIAVRMVSIQTFLDGTLAAGYRGGPAAGGAPVTPPTPPTPPPPPPAPMQVWENPPPLPQPSDEEAERRWQEFLKQDAERWRALDEPRPDTPLPNFDDLDDGLPPPPPPSPR